MFNVLLVEDDLSDVRVFKDILKQCAGCWRMSVVADGEEAMLFLRRKDKYSGVPVPNLVATEQYVPQSDPQIWD